MHSPIRWRVIVFTNVRQPILQAYLGPLLALEDVTELVLVRDRRDASLGQKVQTMAPPDWVPKGLPWKLFGRPFLLRRATGRRSELTTLAMLVHWFPDGPAVLRRARRLGWPVIANIIGGRAELVGGGRRLALAPLPRWVKERAEDYQRRCLDAVDFLTFTGRATEQWYREQGVRRPATAVLHAAIDTAAFAPGGPRDLDLVFVGRVDPDKRVDRLFRVLAEIGTRRPGTTAHLVGVAPEQAARLPGFAAARATLGPGLAVSGSVPNVAEVMRRARVLLLTSDTEGRTLAVLEGMAVGAVPVVTDVGDLAEALGGRSDGAGLVVPLAGDEPALVTALARGTVELLDNESRRAALARRGRALVQREHAPERTREEWHEILAMVRQARSAG